MGCTSSRLLDYDAPLLARRERTKLGVSIIPDRNVRDAPADREEQGRRELGYQRRREARREVAAERGWRWRRGG